MTLDLQIKTLQLQRVQNSNEEMRRNYLKNQTQMQNLDVSTVPNEGQSIENETDANRCQIRDIYHSTDTNNPCNVS